MCITLTVFYKARQNSFYLLLRLFLHHFNQLSSLRIPMPYALSTSCSLCIENSSNLLAHSYPPGISSNLFSFRMLRWFSQPNSVSCILFIATSVYFLNTNYFSPCLLSKCQLNMITMRSGKCFCSLLVSYI
jgi:hypothetical protein